MQKLYYASGFVLLGDEVCSAVVEYAQALANVGKSDLVVVPSLSDEGMRGETRLLVGPASQLFTSPALDRGVDLDDPEAVESMREKTRRLQPARPTVQPRGEGDDSEDDGGTDYL
ncbi:hypothetical protein C5C95_16460 [Rathayibacter sp. AY1B7]|jgi:hypothetical protein|uniref:hypothetical protein n=1 Tax=unclassified Rathayibacter TaxID=2609250 RepID=UPI000CE84F3E|nr:MULTISPECIES: hypothetical protein [unclassified Rathayibacter]PPG58149.1 hypothetical protein C5C69_13250 [Rathayibacter sp. AY1C7]PPG82513.1 hypothetical protein C5C29_13785 [Rathayibacter sp. AY1H2]PPH00818.1 hypothetical protein C5C44_15090 [Rathayibacter sp. AY1F6]PPH50216.1 hypothetical protein C5C67_14070 [Rathayibacter sp. AY1E1]PPH95374.1 hypothetical protein C5C95_16460 [Rathayibacter sp. AY1B7]